jgi:hypothetical protein
MSPYSDKDRPAGSDILPTAEDIAPAALSRTAHQVDENSDTLESQLPMLNGENTTLPASISASFDYDQAYSRFSSRRSILLAAISVVVLISGLGFGLAAYVEHSTKKQVTQANLENQNLKSTLSADSQKRSLHINYNTFLDNGKALTATGTVLVQNDQTAGFSVQNAAGNDLLVVDTARGKVGIGQAPTGNARLQVNGDVSVNGNLISPSNAYSLSSQGLSINGGRLYKSVD